MIQSDKLTWGCNTAAAPPLLPLLSVLSTVAVDSLWRVGTSVLLALSLQVEITTISASITYQKSIGQLIMSSKIAVILHTLSSLVLDEGSRSRGWSTE